MKKNLKKVISAVIAMALSLSSMAAFAAPSFTDVADTASYATAVKTLAALGVISGYEDGSFKPDENITRAEVTTMVVAALNKKDAAAGMAGSTKFDDCNSDATAWASGFINQGVASGFISGFEDGTFKPADNVTYAQIITMLVSCLKYGDYATYMGGYPTGYIAIAQSEGITSGVSANANDAVTRAQVAQLIYNAIDTPIVENTGMTYTTDGKLVPTIQKQDGSSEVYYKSLLTENFNAYAVKGIVTETSRSAGSSSLDADEVKFDIQDGEKYNNNDVWDGGASDAFKDGVLGNITANVGETDAINYILTYADAIIQQDDNDDWTILSFNISGRNKTVEVEASLFDSVSLDGTTVLDDTGATTTETATYSFVKYLTSESSSKTNTYKLANDVDLYVNGVLVPLTVANFTDYVINNNLGNVQFVDAYVQGTGTDGKYDYIFINYYATAQVDTVTTSNSRVTFKDQTVTGSYIELDQDDVDSGDLAYSITYNDAAINFTDLQQDDILSIAYDVSGALKDSKFFDIYVSRDKAEGKYSSKDSSDETVTIADKEYEFVYKTAETFASKTNDLILSDEYTAYVDYFGRIFTWDTNASAAKYAIMDRYVTSSSYDNRITTLYLPDGTVKSSIEVDISKVGGTEQAILDEIYVNGVSGTKAPIQDRVVKYKLSSSTGKIISLEFVNGIEAVDKEYRTRNASIGSIKMSDATNIIDATKYVEQTSSPSTSDLSVASLASAFTDGDTYTAYAYGTKFTDGTYPLVVVTEGASSYNEDTAFAVLTKSLGTKDVSGDSLYEMTALYEGETKSFIISDEAKISYMNASGSVVEDVIDDDNYSTIVGLGDAVMFRLDGTGYIDKMDVIFSTSTVMALTGVGTTDYSAFETKALNNTTISKAVANWRGSYADYTNDWDESDSDMNTLFAFGPIVDKGNNYFTISKIAEMTEGTDSIVAADLTEYTANGLDKIYSNPENIESDAVASLDVSTTSDTRVYVYNFANTYKNAVELGSVGSIVKTSISDSNKITNDANQDVIPWNLYKDGAYVNKGSINFAFAKVVDGTATDVYVFLAK